MFIYTTDKEKKLHRLAFLLSILVMFLLVPLIWWSPNIIVKICLKVFAITGAMYIMFWPVVSYLANPQTFKEVYINKLK